MDLSLANLVIPVVHPAFYRPMSDNVVCPYVLQVPQYHAGIPQLRASLATRPLCLGISLFTVPSGSRGTRGSTRALLTEEAGFGAMGRVAAQVPSPAVRQGPEPWDTW
jgi:hypothetical protein